VRPCLLPLQARLHYHPSYQRACYNGIVGLAHETERMGTTASRQVKRL
jgi:hypothetical protein